jgi:hypothetical protein
VIQVDGSPSRTAPRAPGSALASQGGTVQDPEECAARVAEALAQLRQALDHVERARLLL